MSVRLSVIAFLLCNRSQNVVVNGKISKSSSVTSGVSQGTVLGPLLFLLYINDISTDINSKIRLFSDDSVIYREINSIQDAMSLQDDLFKLQRTLAKRQKSFGSC